MADFQGSGGDRFLIEEVFGAGAPKLIFVRPPAGHDGAGRDSFPHLVADGCAAADFVENVELAPFRAPEEIGSGLPV